MTRAYETRVSPSFVASPWDSAGRRACRPARSDSSLAGAGRLHPCSPGALRAEEGEDGRKIEGRSRLQGAQLSSYGDHRVAMALAVAGLSSEGGVEIDDSACVDISFPGFFDLLEGVSAS